MRLPLSAVSFLLTRPIPCSACRQLLLKNGFEIKKRLYQSSGRFRDAARVSDEKARNGRVARVGCSSRHSDERETHSQGALMLRKCRITSAPDEHGNTIGFRVPRESLGWCAL